MRVVIAYIECESCGRRDLIGGDETDQGARNRLREEGWLCGHDDRCPKCVELSTRKRYTRAAS